MTTVRERAIAKLDRYATEAVARSKRQYDREGSLLEKAQEVFPDPAIWQVPWVPEVFDLGEARLHPVYEQRFSSEQKLAWNHLQWGLDYARVAQGEMQLVDLNRWAVRQYQGVLPSVVELEDRESFEEEDHIHGFGLGLKALEQRYLPNRPGALYAASPSGFSSRRVNKVFRHAMGLVAEKVLGRNFPTMFFVNRGLKTHGFKPFENAIARFEHAHEGMRRLSHLHRLDESRHMASAHYLGELSNDILDTVGIENRWVFHAAMVATWPRGRQLSSRTTYWANVLEHSPTFADIPKAERDALMAHVCDRLEANLGGPMLEFEAPQVLPTNKRLLETCGLSPEMKRVVLDYLRGTHEHGRMVSQVELPEA